MIEWLQQDFVTAEIAWQTMGWRLLTAACLGFLVAGVYQLSQRRSNGSQLPLITTLVLLTILVAMTTLVIGDSVARAFGLVGALSIVRFRTVVEDTRDTAFVIFAVVIGMAIGSGHGMVCLIGVPIVSVAAIGLSRFGDARLPSGEKKLEVRFGAGHNLETRFAEIFRAHLVGWRQTAAISARQGAAFDLIYVVRLRNPEGLLELVRALNAVEGVQSVELRDV